MLKRLIMVIFIVFGAFLILCLYKTFAYDTSVVEETPSTTDLEYTFKIGNSSIKQITVDSGETKYYDVVLSNPNPAKISYGIYYEMVSPGSKPDGFSIEYTSKSTGESTGKVDKEGNITLNLVVTNTSSSTVTVKLGSIAGYVNGGNLELRSNQEFIPKKKFPKATELVENLNDNSTGDTGSGVYKVHHDAIPADNSATGKIIEATDDYRYYGSNPNNYICLDMEENITCPDKHLYRIIGSIYDELNGKYKLKILKNQYLTDGKISIYNWNNGDEKDWKWAEITETDGKGSKSFANVNYSVMHLLNNGAWWNKSAEQLKLNVMTSDFETLPYYVTVDFSNNGLNDKHKNLIDKSRYYLGNVSSLTINANEYYKQERGTLRTRTTAALYWDGYVALMYPSDFYYAAGNNCVKNYNGTGNYTEPCVNYNWLTVHNKCNLNSPIGESVTDDLISIEGELLLTTMNSNNNDNPSPEILYKGYEEDPKKENISSMDYASQISMTIRPVFYLKPEVVITTGDGSEQNPYQISLP